MLLNWSLIVTESVALLAAGFEAPANIDGEPVPLAQQDLQAMTDAAVQRWLVSGLLDAGQIARIEAIDFQIADLSGATLGLTTADTIYIDVDAAGYGWYVDPTPSNDTEFRSTRSGALVAGFYSDASDRMDLLSVVMHEIGHFVGFEHGESGPVAETTLEAGQRIALSGSELRMPAGRSSPALFDEQVSYTRNLTSDLAAGRHDWRKSANHSLTITRRH